ncbi:MAG: DUF1987 domain-containing protein [Flavobacteriales bacterium]|nr:DUF1987 domain-containing protein [Flavobacteriales bacterium]
MNKLNIEATRTTPLVTMDPENGVYLIQGISTPLNALEFFNVIVHWIDANETHISSGSQFVFHLPYFNSASSKGLVFVLKALRKVMQAGRNIHVLWEVEKDDEFMMEAAQMFAEYLQMEISIHEVVPVGRL